MARSAIFPFSHLARYGTKSASDSGNCLGRRCPTYNKCFYYKDRRRMQHAQILVVNHALLFSDIALRRAGVSILPDYDVVILDEAHTVEAVASDHLGINVTSGQIEYALNKLYNDRTNKGLLVHHGLLKEQQQVDRCRQLADEFFADLLDWKNGSQTEKRPTAPGSAGGHPTRSRVNDPAIVANHLSPELESLAQPGKSSPAKNSAKNPSNKISSPPTIGSPRWPPKSKPGARKHKTARSTGSNRTKPAVVFRDITLSAAPIDIGPAMREQLFDKVPTVILTSATLSVGRALPIAGELRSPETPPPPSPSSNPASASPGAMKSKSAAPSTTRNKSS